MQRKGYSCIAIALVLSLLLSQLMVIQPVFGAETAGVQDTVYVSSDSTGGPGNGTQNAPFQSLAEAYRIVKDGGTIVIAGGYVSQTKETTPAKKITIKGDTAEAYWTIRDGLALGGDLTIDNLKLETTVPGDSEIAARTISVNGHRFVMTDSAQCYVNENDKQKAYINAGKNGYVQIDGGRFAELQGEKGASFVIGANATFDRISGEQIKSLTINAPQTLIGSLANIKQLNINSRLKVYQLNGIGTINLTSSLEVTDSQKPLSISGDLSMGDATIYYTGDSIEVGGTVSGSGKLSPNFHGTITAAAATQEANFSYYPQMGRVLERSNENGRVVWTSELQGSTLHLFLNGSRTGAGNQDGVTQETAFTTLESLLKAAGTKDAANIRIHVCGDTEVSGAFKALNKS